MKFVKILAVIAITAVMAAAEFQGNGTRNAPYLINNINDLRRLRGLVNSGGNNEKFNNPSVHYRLTNNIHLPLELDGWTPIGTAVSPFRANFDGGGIVLFGRVFFNNEITNLKLPEYGGLVGFFGYIKNGTVKNLTVRKISRLNYTITGNSIGVLAGSIIEGVIENCSVFGTMYLNNATMVGGLVGYAMNSQIINSHSRVDLLAELRPVEARSHLYNLATHNGIPQVGDFVGNIDNNKLGSVNSILGGLVGENENGVITNSSSAGNIRGIAKVGGLVGYNWRGGIINRSQSSATVEAVEEFGVLVGINNGTIKNSNANGKIETKNIVKNGLWHKAALRIAYVSAPYFVEDMGMYFVRVYGDIADTIYFDEETSGRIAGINFNDGTIVNSVAFSGIETAGSVAFSGSESAGSVAFTGTNRGTVANSVLALRGSETAAVVASSIVGLPMAAMSAIGTKSVSSGGGAFVRRNSGRIINCYYENAEGLSDPFATGKSREFIQSREFAELLNANVEEMNASGEFDGITLSRWGIEENEESEEQLSHIFSEDDIAIKVQTIKYKETLELPEDENTVWSIYSGSAAKIEGNLLIATAVGAIKLKALITQGEIEDSEEEWEDIVIYIDINIEKADGGDVSAPVLASATSNSITINAVEAPNSGQSVEYAIGTNAYVEPAVWQTELTFRELKSNTSYYVFARSAESNNYNAGTASVSEEIKTLGNSSTSINNAKKSNSRHGIRFVQNPVSENAEISVVLPDGGRIISAPTVVIYDMTGNMVFECRGDCPQSPAPRRGWEQSDHNNAIIWDLRNRNGRLVANGTYLVIAEAKSASGKVYRYSAKLGVKR